MYTGSSKKKDAYNKRGNGNAKAGDTFTSHCPNEDTTGEATANPVNEGQQKFSKRTPY